MIVLRRRDRFGRMGGAYLSICFCIMKGQKQLDTYNECTKTGNCNKRYCTRWMMSSKTSKRVRTRQEKIRDADMPRWAKTVAEAKVACCCSSNTRNRSCFGGRARIKPVKSSPTPTPTHSQISIPFNLQLRRRLAFRLHLPSLH